MTFTVSTKPLQDVIGLAIITSNISKFYQKSCVVQLNAQKDTLKINVEASDIYSCATLKGQSDSDDNKTIFVDSSLFKQLVSSFDSNAVSLEFQDNALILRSGSSKFSLPKLADASEVTFTEPTVLDNPELKDIGKSSWKLIKDHQMFALAASFINPIYKQIWVGNAEGDVLVGDYDNSIFTKSTGGDIKEACLLSDTVINLFNSVPDGSKFYKNGDNYIINVVTDSYNFVSEFCPKYESDENVGSYNSDIILNLMNKQADSFIEMDVASVTKFMSQLDILSTSSDDEVTVSYENSVLTINCKDSLKTFECKGSINPFKATFKRSLFKSVISNYTEKLNFTVSYDESGDVSGILFWDDKLTVVLGVM